MSEEVKETTEAVAEETKEAPEAAEETKAPAAEEAPAEEAAAEEAPEKEEKKDDAVVVSFESLGLSKPLDKMTAKELREMVMAKLPGITGVSGMNKDEILAAIREVFGITEDTTVSPYKDQILTIKREIKELRVKKESLESRKDREIMRRKINKLKKRTRSLARAV